MVVSGSTRFPTVFNAVRNLNKKILKFSLEQAANSYEIAETLNVIRGANPKAEMIYQEHFNKARTMMKRIAEDYEKEYSDRFQCGCKDEDCIAWVEEMPVYLTQSGAIKDWNNRAYEENNDANN